MTTQVMVTGKLAVDVETDSIYFGYNVPLEIRDSRMRVVKKTATEREFDLSPGLYQVSAVLEDGNEHERIVEIKPNETSTISLRTPDIVVSTKAAKAGAKRPAEVGFARYTLAEADDASLPDVQLLDVSGAVVKMQRRTMWQFDCDAPLHEVATATFGTGDSNTEISLPTSPGGGPTPNSCYVRVEHGSRGPRVTAWISPERTVASAFMNMMASGHVRQAAKMAKEATDLLRDKYSDPVGATLGALILHKVDRLKERESWVANLANDFAWIPDGRILLASLKFRRRAELDEAIALAVEASSQRMLFTDSYSLLLDLLRRWPREADRGTRYEAMAKLAAHSPHLDWDSICLSRIERN